MTCTLAEEPLSGKPRVPEFCVDRQYVLYAIGLLSGAYSETAIDIGRVVAAQSESQRERKDFAAAYGASIDLDRLGFEFAHDGLRVLRPHVSALRNRSMTTELPITNDTFSRDLPPRFCADRLPV